jgi:hypothetical protein
MAEYLLVYGQPRLSSHVPSVIYEAKRLRATHPCDTHAIRWARDEVPHLHGISKAEAAYPAAPMVLWRVGPTKRELVWESQPGMALHAMG